MGEGVESAIRGVLPSSPAIEGSDRCSEWGLGHTVRRNVEGQEDAVELEHEDNEQEEEGSDDENVRNFVEDNFDSVVCSDCSSASGTLKRTS